MFTGVMVRVRAIRCASVLGVGTALLSAPGAAAAVEQLGLELGDISGPGWNASGVRVSLNLAQADKLSLDVRVAKVTLPDPIGRLERLALNCPVAVMTPGRFSCAGGTVQIGAAPLGPGPLRASIDVDHQSGVTKVTIKGLQLLAGTLAADVALDKRGWRLDVHADGVAASELGALLAPFDLLAGIELGDGTLALQGQASGRGALDHALDRANLNLQASDIAFSDEAGLRAGEGLNADISLSLHSRGDIRDVSSALTLSAGQMLFDPVGIEVGDESLQLNVALDWDPGRRRLDLRDIRLLHPGVLDLQAELAMSFDEGARYERMRLSLTRTALQPLYEAYLQVPLTGTSLDAIEPNGEVSFRFDWAGPDTGVAALSLHRVGFTETAGRFEFGGFDGTLEWSEGDRVRESRIAWQGGRIYRLPIGPGEFVGLLNGRNFEFVQPLAVPLLDGELRIDELTVRDIASPKLRWRLRGALRPVSLQALSSALEWPAFGGTLGGEIPSVTYADGAANIDGSLLMRVFDGEIAIRNLRLEDPFGVVPVLGADIDFNDISLDLLTTAFSFGKIQGRLGGYVRDLVLEDWRPSAFDARFATPENDRSRHRISQRAVDNISSLGGGASGAVSKTFLRFFEEFSYDSLGINCRLRNGVCEMSGIAPADRGYYLVRGGGLPRIDVVGFNPRVNWDELLQRLEAAVNAESIRVEQQ